jgi:hypothetical protein
MFHLQIWYLSTKLLGISQIPKDSYIKTGTLADFSKTLNGFIISACLYVRLCLVAGNNSAHIGSIFIDVYRGEFY